ncbi:MAG: hypothetical protein IPK82_19110 [Polyangiaceae bacterium]|nr:hypothetical protein [Polyangiaceae bacterium]
MDMPVDVWERVRRGKHSALLGVPLSDPPADLRVVRVSCDLASSTLGPLLEARDRVERIVGTETPFVEAARARVLTGLRRHLLGDLPTVASEGSLVDVLNRFALLGPAALVLEHIEMADSASLDMLRHILARPGWLRLPLILSGPPTTRSPALQSLIEAVQNSAGQEAIVRALSETAPQSTHAERPFEPSALPADVLRVLRALAIAGAAADANAVAAIIDGTEMGVLDALQRAFDAGVRIEDRGEGRFVLSPDVVDVVRSSMLPSFAAALHRRAAAILSDSRPTPPPVAPPAMTADVRPGNAWDVMAAEPAPPTLRLEKEDASPSTQQLPISQAPSIPAESPSVYTPTEKLAPVEARGTLPSAVPQDPVPAREAESDAHRIAEEAAQQAILEAHRVHAERVEKEAQARRAAEDIAEAAVLEARRSLAEERLKTHSRLPFSGDPEVSRTPRPAEWLSPLASEPPSDPPPPRTHSKVARPSQLRTEDDARAAQHLVKAGDISSAIERYTAAMRKAAARAAYPQAVAHAQAALSLLDRLPSSNEHRLERVALLLEAGRLLWHGAGPDDSFTLQGAARVLEAARASLHAGDPSDLVADVAVAIAGVLYDIGDVRSLSRALEELATASRTLANDGNAQAAARLFNDQAAVLIRMGDPVRAAHLLTESRKIFEPNAKTDPVSLVEIAETDHLFARILLTVPARPGKADDALNLGLDHALAAERAFRHIGAPREAARVLQTMGLLELRKGRFDRAAEHLTNAAHIQESMGDVIGLAESTAALSGVLAADKHYLEALRMLGNSIVLHFEKGSAYGVAQNRRAFTALLSGSDLRNSAPDLVSMTEKRLAAAEGALGRIELPPTS